MIELRRLTNADIAAHNSGEDAESVKWLTGEYGTYESTRHHFDDLARNSEVGSGKRGFGVWLDRELAGYVECDPVAEELLETGDVNVSYSVHPWARGRGVATAAVELICAFIAEESVGLRALPHIADGNRASMRVVEKCGFAFIGELPSLHEKRSDGSPIVYRYFARDLHR